jgi:hypothetical protein
VALVASLCTAAYPETYPEFEINLDLPEVQRFQEVSKHFAKEVVLTIDSISDQFPTICKIAELFFEGTSWIWKFTQKTAYYELKGIATAINSPSLPLSKLIMMNSIYELRAWCTSIIAKQADGTIIHSRDLDYLSVSLFNNMTYRAKFTKGGEPLFDAVMFAGNTGIYTGMRPGGFAISQNTRSFDKNPLSLIANMVMLFGGYEQESNIIRDTLATCGDFSCAYDRLSTQPNPSYGYIILSGVKDDEGVVIARKRFGDAHESWLDSKNGTWFLVQTNNDHWDSGCYNRCAAATEKMQAIGQESISHQTIRKDVMWQFPTDNGNTLYNTDFTAVKSFMSTIPSSAIPHQADSLAGKYQADKPYQIDDYLEELEGSAQGFTAFLQDLNDTYLTY